jgi:hypothetical protein
VYELWAEPSLIESQIEAELDQTLASMPALGPMP